ncbi:MAG: hypothetical protein KDA67_10630 [Rhodobacteraceae bacterium]|nr:hypothetical protein [Paracoccaceae bacterium]
MLVTPLKFHVGSLLLTPERLFLLIMFLPLTWLWLSGRAGSAPILTSLFLAFSIWNGLSLIAVHGLGHIQFAGITFLETFGAYLGGRALIRTPEDYDRMVRILTLIMLVFVPAALLESLTGIRIFSIIAGKIAETHAWVYASGYEKRLGMFRSQSVFEHPILFGVFSSCTFGLLYFSNRRSGAGISGYRKAWLSVAATFLSLSSGTWLSIMAQVMMVTWNTIFRGVRNHWKVLLGLVILAYVVVDMISNRTPFEVFISYATFSAHNGYYRITTFIYGMQNVWMHPLFGIGLNDWVRPHWMGTSSVDNFWLVVTMRNGIPAFSFLALFYLGNILRMTRLGFVDPKMANRRTGMVVALIGSAVTLATVHIWGSVYIFFMFLLGTCVWMKPYAKDGSNKTKSVGIIGVGRRGNSQYTSSARAKQAQRR